VKPSRFGFAEAAHRHQIGSPIVMLAVFRFLISSALALALAAPAAAAGAPPLDINVITSLTGSAAFVGKSQQSGLDALEKSLNATGGYHGRRVHFIYADDQSNPQVGIQLVSTLTAAKVPAVLGASLAATCRALAAANTAGPVEYCISPGIDPAPGSFTFSASADFASFVGASVRYLHGRGWKRIALLTTTDTTGQLGEKAFAAALARPENHDLVEAANEHYGVTDLQITAQLAAIKAANVDAIFLWVAGTPFLTAMRGLRDAGIDVPVLSGSANMVTDLLRANAATLPRTLLFQGIRYVTASSSEPIVQKYLAALHADGLTSDLQTGIGWDPALILIDTLAALGPNANAEAVRAHIAGLRNFPGISGTYDFQTYPQRGIGENAVIVMRWDTVTAAPVLVSAPGGAPLR
jgi:branched-chain amino acid transport system substrate-binding protein